jgi:TP901 family phage tail tape measure protein
MGARTIGHLGRVAALAGVVTVGAFGMMADGAAKYETQATRVATQTGKIGTGAETVVKNAKILGPAMRDIFADSTSSLEQVTEAGYDLFSTIDQIGESTKGLKTGVGMLKLFSDAAIAGGTDIETVTNGVVSVLAAFKEMPQTTEQARKILNRMFAAVRFGRIDFAEFAKSMETTTPAAKAASQSFDTMAGTLAFATKPLGAAFARVGFARLVEQLSRSKFIDNLKEAGVEIVNAKGKMLQLPEVIERITKKFPKLKEGGVTLSQFFKEMSKTEGTIQARRLFTFLATDLDGYRRILGKTTKDNNQFDRDLKAMEATTGVRWQKLINQFKAFALMIGADVLPEILKLQPYIERFTTWFKNLSDETRGQYARWALIAGGIALVGGAFAAVTAGILSFIGLVGRVTGGLNLFKFGLIGLIAYLVIFRKEWADIGQLAGKGLDLATGSIQGFLIAAGALLIMMAKIRKTWVATQIAFAAGGAAGASGGLIPMMFGGAGRGTAAVKTLRMMNQEMKAAKVMSTGARYMRMAGAAALFLPGPLKVAAVALGTFGAAAYLWHRRTERMAKEAAEVRGQFNQFATPFRGMTNAAYSLQFFMNSWRGAKAAALDVRELKIQVAQTWAQLKKTPPGFSKDLLRVQLERLKMQLQDAETAYAKLTNKAQSALNATQRFAQNSIALEQQRIRIQNQIALNQKKIDALRTTGAGRRVIPGQESEVLRLNRAIQNLQRNLQTLGLKSAQAGALFSASFRKVVASMQKADLVPKKLGEGVLAAAERFFAKGAKLTPKNLRIFFKAYLDPSSNIPGQIAAAAKKAKKQDIKFKATVELAHAKATLDERKFQQSLPKGTTVSWKLDEKAKNATQAATKTWGEVNAIVTKPHTLKVNPPPNLGGIGAAISAGIAAGMTPITQKVIQQVVKDPLTKGVEAHSPSRWAMREVGAPLAQGIAIGFYNEMLNLAPQAALTMSLFTSPMLQKLQEDIDRAKEIVQELAELGGKQARKIADARDTVYASKDKGKNAKAIARRVKEIKSDIKMEREDLEKELQGLRRVMTMKDLIADMQATARSMKAWNDNMARLLARGVPRRMLDDLAEMGIEGARYLAMLAGATERELRRFVRAWNMAETQRRRSMRTTVEEELGGTKQAVETGGQALLDKWNEIKAELEAAYGGINADVMNAAAEYNANLRSFFQGAMGSLFGGVSASLSAQQSAAQAAADAAVNAHNQALEEALSAYRQKVDEMRQMLENAFGELFHGPWLDSEEMRERLDWGYILNGADLIKDLQMQLDQFKKWLKALADLGSRGLPPELLEMLRQLGPSALPMLLALQNMTDEELEEYLKLWKEKGDIIASEIAKIPGVMGEMMGEMIVVLKATMADLMADLRAQTEAFRIWRQDLGTLLARGIPRDMFDELMELGPEAAEWIHILATSTDPELAAYVEMWKQRAAEIEAAIDQFSKATTPEEILEAMKKQALGFVAWEETLQELINRGLPTELINQLRAMGPEALPYLQALNAMTDEQLFGEGGYVSLWELGHKQIADATQTFFDQQLQAWTAQGASIATALIAGVMSEQEQLLSFFRNLFQSLLAEAHRETRTASPSKVYYDLGRNMMLGLQDGLNSINPSVNMPVAGGKSFLNGGTGYGGGNGTTVNMEVNAMHSESLETTLNRASFRLRTRR